MGLPSLEDAEMVGETIAKYMIRNPFLFLATITIESFFIYRLFKQPC